jgi:hypothetical protein
MPIDWNDPTARFALIGQVGPHRFNELHAEYMRRSTIASVAGHAIRSVISQRFGRLFVVGDTGRVLDPATSRNLCEEKPAIMKCR